MTVFQFIPGDELTRFKQCPEHTFLGGAGTDDVGSDTVHGAVEEVQPVVYPAEGICADDFAEEFLCRVIHYCHVVGIPADRTAYVEHEFRYEAEQCGNLVRRAFSRVIMSCVDGRDLAVCCRIGRIEVVRADGEALQPDAEDLALDAVLHIGLLLAENLVERVLEQAAIQVMID